MEKQAPIAGGAAVLRVAGAPDHGFLWLAGWVVLNFLAIPAALLLVAPFAMPYFWLAGLGSRAGWWPEMAQSIPLVLGFFTAFALLLATGQWLMLRRLLPSPGRWFAATALGAWLAGAAVSGVARLTGADLLGPAWILGLLLAMGGGSLGLAQWLVLRRYARRAGWLVLIDGIAVTSLILLPRTSLTNLFEIVRALLMLSLPGVISGLGLWLLLRHSRAEKAPAREGTTSHARIGIWRSAARIALALVAAAALFFLMIWVYAASQLSLAKARGIYPSVEEAVIGTNSAGWGGARVISITDIQTGPNRWDGSQPHVWFGTAIVKFDRIPDGYSRLTSYVGSYYIHTREGWVFMGEGAFPEFIGWVMDLYHMEGVE